MGGYSDQIDDEDSFSVNGLNQEYPGATKEDLGMRSDENFELDPDKLGKSAHGRKHSPPAFGEKRGQNLRRLENV